MRGGQRAGEPHPLHLQKFRRDARAVFLGLVDHHRSDERHAFGEHLRLSRGKIPFEPEVALRARLRGLRDDGDEERAGVDLLADLGIPRVAAAQLVLIEPHFEPGTAQRFGNAPRRRRVVTGIAEEDRLGRRVWHREAERAQFLRSPSRLASGLCGG